MKNPFFLKAWMDFCQKIPIFKLQTLEGEDINGYFYKENLKPVQKHYLIPEKILKEKQKYGQGREVLIERKGTTNWINIEELFIPGKPKTKKRKNVSYLDQCCS